MKFDHIYILDNLIPNAASRKGKWSYVYDPNIDKKETLFILVNSETNEEANIEELEDGYVVSINGKEVYRSELKSEKL